MPDLTTLPLNQLLQRCPPLTQPLSHADEAAWAELERRAFYERSDAAWDALVGRLWSTVIAWLYIQKPDLAPADAELVTQRTIWAFYQERISATPFEQPNDPYATPALPPLTSQDGTGAFPIPSIVTQLQHCLARSLSFD